MTVVEYANLNDVSEYEVFRRAAIRMGVHHSVLASAFAGYMRNQYIPWWVNSFLSRYGEMEA